MKRKGKKIKKKRRRKENSIKQSDLETSSKKYIVYIYIDI